MKSTKMLFRVISLCLMACVLVSGITATVSADAPVVVEDFYKTIIKSDTEGYSAGNWKTTDTVAYYDATETGVYGKAVDDVSLHYGNSATGTLATAALGDATNGHMIRFNKLITEYKTTNSVGTIHLSFQIAFDDFNVEKLVQCNYGNSYSKLMKFTTDGKLVLLNQSGSGQTNQKQLAPEKWYKIDYVLENRLVGEAYTLYAKLYVDNQQIGNEITYGNTWNNKVKGESVYFSGMMMVQVEYGIKDNAGAKATTSTTDFTATGLHVDNFYCKSMIGGTFTPDISGVLPETYDYSVISHNFNSGSVVGSDLKNELDYMVGTKGTNTDTIQLEALENENAIVMRKGTGERSGGSNAWMGFATRKELANTSGTCNTGFIAEFDFLSSGNFGTGEQIDVFTTGSANSYDITISADKFSFNGGGSVSYLPNTWYHVVYSIDAANNKFTFIVTDKDGNYKGGVFDRNKKSAGTKLSSVRFSLKTSTQHIESDPQKYIALDNVKLTYRDCVPKVKAIDAYDKDGNQLQQNISTVPIGTKTLKFKLDAPLSEAPSSGVKVKVMGLETEFDEKAERLDPDTILEDEGKTLNITLTQPVRSNANYQITFDESVKTSYGIGLGEAYNGNTYSTISKNLKIALKPLDVSSVDFDKNESVVSGTVNIVNTTGGEKTVYVVTALYNANTMKDVTVTAAIVPAGGATPTIQPTTLGAGDRVEVYVWDDTANMLTSGYYIYDQINNN